MCWSFKFNRYKHTVTISLDILGSVTTTPSAAVQVVAEVHRKDDDEELDEQFLLNPDEMGEDGEDLEDVAKEGRSTSCA